MKNCARFRGYRAALSGKGHRLPASGEHQLLIEIIPLEVKSFLSKRSRPNRILIVVTLPWATATGLADEHLQESSARASTASFAARRFSAHSRALARLAALTSSSGSGAGSATFGTSATCNHIPSSSLSPSHFRDLFFLPSDRFSPPPPSQTRPSAVLTTMSPVGLTDKQCTNGGESDTVAPSDAVGAAVRWKCAVQQLTYPG